jgi:GNAT superfamily N-acetyltransferase
VDFSIRPGRPDDQVAIEAFTRDTFEWGDYVAHAYEGWLADDTGRTLIAEIDGDTMGLARVASLSDQEAWLQGVRVHPEHRRRGVGTALAAQACRWARSNGAKVIRLAVESWNRPARTQFERSGFRPVNRWVAAERAVGEASPVPEGNGGRRVPAPERLRPAPAAEASAAMMSWASGPLGKAARNMFATDWRWRRLTADDLVDAARRRLLWEGRPGWAMARVNDDTFDVSWLETAPDDAAAMARALIDCAAVAGVERLLAVVPAVTWLRQAFQRLGCRIHPMWVYARAV